MNLQQAIFELERGRVVIRTTDPNWRPGAYMLLENTCPNRILGKRDFYISVPGNVIYGRHQERTMLQYHLSYEDCIANDWELGERDAISHLS